MFNIRGWIFTAFYIISLPFIIAFSKKVQIGGLFDGDEILEKMFEISSKYVNRQRFDPELGRIHIQAKSMNVSTDAFEVAEEVCTLFSMGVAGIFGPSDKITARHVQSMCDMMEVPHISISWDPDQERLKAINLFPYADAYSNVYYELVKEFEWQTVTIIYDTSDSLIRMHQILKMWDPKGHPITIRRLGDGPNYRPVLKKVKDSGEENLIIDCSIDILAEVLKQALQVGILSDKNRLIVANLDLQTLDIEPYQYTGMNFTGVRLIDPENERIQELLSDEYGLDFTEANELRVEHALMFDAVQLFARAFKQLRDAVVGEVKQLFCNGAQNWEHGISLSNFMRSTEMMGLTGLIKFDTAGYRSDFQLDIIKVDKDGLEKIGTYNSTFGIEWTPTPATISLENQLSLRNTTFRVLIALTKPYSMLKETSKKMIGNDQYEGFACDIIDEISKMLGFNYTFMVQEDNVYGSLLPNGQWNGMLRRIMDNEADLGITDLTITSDRESAVDFTTPFMNLGITILYKKPTKAPPSVMSFLAPFSSTVYLYLVLTYILISVSFLIIGRMSPQEWNNPYPCVEEPEELENQWNLKNSFWFTIGSIMQQGSDVAPRGPGTRVLAGAWYFFCLIIVSSYTANLAAFLTVETVVRPIKDVDDLVNQNVIKYGAKKDGSTFSFFKVCMMQLIKIVIDSNDSRYKRMYKYMMDNAQHALPAGNEEGITRVLTDNYAFLMESSSIEYIQERECGLSAIGKNLDSKGYGIAMRKNSTYRNDLSAAVLKLQENGVLTKLKTKWWREKRGGGRCVASFQFFMFHQGDVGGGSPTELGLPNVGGVFLVLLIGCGLAAIATIIQFVLKVMHSAYKDKESMEEVLKQEIIFALKCHSTKPARKRKDSSNTESGNSKRSRSMSPCGFISKNITPDESKQ